MYQYLKGSNRIVLTFFESGNVNPPTKQKNMSSHIMTGLNNAASLENLSEEIRRVECSHGSVDTSNEIKNKILASQFITFLEPV